MQMQLKQPERVRELLAERKSWLTIEEIAVGLEMHRNTVRKVLSGKPVDAKTVRSVAAAIGENVMSIAGFKKR